MVRIPLNKPVVYVQISLLLLEQLVFRRNYEYAALITALLTVRMKCSKLACLYLYPQHLLGPTKLTLRKYHAVWHNFFVLQVQKNHMMSTELFFQKVSQQLS